VTLANGGRDDSRRSRGKRHEQRGGEDDFEKSESTIAHKQRAGVAVTRATIAPESSRQVFRSNAEEPQWLRSRQRKISNTALRSGAQKRRMAARRVG
jgi:hypothetical protein